MKRCLLAFLVACGGGSGSDDLAGIDPDKTVGELDPSEMTQLCHQVFYPDYGMSAEDALRYRCYTVAITLHHQYPNLFDCVDTVTQCIASDGSDTGSDSESKDYNDCTMASADDLGTCAQLTIGEIDACFDAIAATAQKLVGTITCDTSEDTFSIPPAACDQVVQLCPSLIDD
ncbi:MAG: hypothetical protein QM831_17310 [Kofleriaceae bacterium]